MIDKSAVWLDCFDTQEFSSCECDLLVTGLAVMHSLPCLGPHRAKKAT